MGTAITYQGRFTSGGSPANGVYDFEFRLFDTLTGGNQVGSTVTKDDLSVSDGYFTTSLDFGSGVFTGDARWLQIAVRPGAETGVYTVLTPRHELTPTPYTLYTNAQGTANYIPKFIAGGMTSSLLYDSGSRIGIGMTNPGYILDVNGRIRIKSSQGSSGIWLRDAADSADASFVGRTEDSYAATGIYAAGWKLVVSDSGNVGIGTTSPQAKLQVGANVLGTIPANTQIWSNYDLRFSSGGDSDARYGSYLKPGWTGTGSRLTLGLRANTIDTDVVTIAGTKVGIATASPTQALDVNGNIRCIECQQTSDERLKTDVRPLGGVLDRLGQVRAVSFRWNEKAQSLGARADVKRIGVLAQELEQVFPELVDTPEPDSVSTPFQNPSKWTRGGEVHPDSRKDADRAGYKSVNYSELTAVLLEAVKELRQENEALRRQNDSLESRLVRLEESSSRDGTK